MEKKLKRIFFYKFPHNPTNFGIKFFKRNYKGVELYRSMKHHQKLELIENYVAIYRVLYNCKEILLVASTTPPANTKVIEKIQSMCDQTLDLKSKYEEAFKKLNMIDTSFLILKKQLTDCKGYEGKKPEPCTLKELLDSIEIIESDYKKLKL